MPTRVVSRWPIGNLLCPSPSTAALPSPYTEQSFQRRLGKMTGSGGDKDEEKIIWTKERTGKSKGTRSGKGTGRGKRTRTRTRTRKKEKKRTRTIQNSESVKFFDNSKTVCKIKSLLCTETRG